MHKDLFDDAIGEVPPSTIDVDAAITRGRRAARLRRVANPAVAAGVAVVLGIGVVAFTMTRGEDDGGGIPAGAQPGPTTSKTSTTTPPTTTVPPSTGAGGPEMLTPADNAVPPSQCDAQDLESTRDAISRLTQATKTALHRQRNDLQLSANPDAAFPQGVQHGPLEYYQINPETPGKELPICDPHGYLMTMATTQAADGQGNVLITIKPAFTIEGQTLNCEGDVPMRTQCTEVTGPNGESIVRSTFEFGGGTLTYRVEMVRPDGTELMLQAENVGTSTKNKVPPSAATPPLSHDQLVAIGTDPSLTVFPK